MEKIKLNAKCTEIKTVTTETDEGEKEQIRTSFTEVKNKEDEVPPQKVSITGKKLKIAVGEEIQFELFPPQKKLTE
ncbi:MAG: hypothetical protein Sv326_0424 [Candidatus Fermentimicrarchaeum limneticum]|uniref:Uncharacterized protein n=1 Tax=Fermentimicrarchaeum limneticum TaxID=2795018 RepID=A0A7D5XBP7_FERL1|nr:MAG: hypothetical protein Sv326_0350 [Candidatus Fermentimicrarchaeum limneticum]QLJ52562.1 MAG: hypothetical protein Sv326_0387 [Candidatus Fermentimicrarchaeum limneticum]QLJ52599.1 MAG: hypothetical protein Sv326_0424 [Candidatus Fermentimicrarchaeum limneticum]